jgi:hypothetical protein
MSNQKQKSNAQPLAGDDRNIVELGADAPGLSFEERVTLFWDTHKKTIVAAAVTIVLITALSLGWTAYSNHVEKSIRSSFAKITDNEGYAAFIAQHPRHPLAAVAHLMAADDSFANRRYADAAASYDSAAAILPASDPIGSRARLYAALSRLEDGDRTTANEALEKLADDTTAPASFRAQAAFHRAVSAASTGDMVAANEWATKVTTLDEFGPWADRASTLRRLASMPRAVSSVEVVPAPVTGEPAPAPEGTSEPTPVIQFPTVP